jgi:very-short-patch-repair endonuclease
MGNVIVVARRPTRCTFRRAPSTRVIVEVDGFHAHGSRLRFETDRSRDTALLAAGYRVLRFTWRQLSEEPEVVAARLAVVLAQRFVA